MSQPRKNQPVPLANELLEQYVQYEVQRWSAGRVEETLRGEFDALWALLGDLTLREAASVSQVTAIAQRVLCETPITPDLARAIEEAVVVIHESLLRDKTSVSDLFPHRRFEQLLEVLVGLKSLRRELVGQVTASSVYAMLVADILYHGIKSFVLTDNVLARTLPGASSLIRFGQKTLNSAAPNLEKTIDRNVIAFINANIKATVSQSEAFLDSVLDDEMFWKIGAETWDSNAHRSVGEFAAFIDGASVLDMTDLTLQSWDYLRTTHTFRTCLQQVVTLYFGRYGDTPVTALLERAGLDSQARADLALVLAPLFEQSLSDPRTAARAEAHYRAHFQAFLDWQATRD